MAGHPYGGPVGDPYNGPGFRGHSKAASKGGPKTVQRSTANQLKEHQALFTTYEHLAGLERGDAALLMLRKAASLVKPIMQKHGWKVQVLAEFLPPESNLLGLNINKGYKICIRLRYHNNHDLFLPFDEVVDTLLHELCHNVWNDHDSNFHKLWEELRDEHEALVRKGYTGEGFLSEGKRLGGSGGHVPPLHEMRRLARVNAEKRRAQGALFNGSGQRLGGTPIHLQGQDIRKVIADQAIRRKAINTGCASGSQNAIKLSEQAESNAFKTKAEEDDANNLAISKALQELMEQEEDHKLNGTFDGSASGAGLAWSAESGLYDAGTSRPPSNVRHDHPSEEEQMKWALEDSMRCAGEASSVPEYLQDFVASTERSDRIGQLAQEHTIQNTFSPEDPDRTASPEEDPDRTASPEEDPDRTASLVADPNRTAAPQAQPPNQSHKDHASIKRKRPDSQTSTPDHQHKQQPIIIQDDDELPQMSSPTAGNDWACEVCTCINPLQFLACDACGVERPQSVLLRTQPKRKPLPARVKYEPPAAVRNESLGWNCRCGAFMEHKWWTCSACGTLKASS